MEDQPFDQTDKIARANVGALLKRLSTGKPLTRSQLNEVNAFTKTPGGRARIGIVPTMKACAGVTGISMEALKAAKNAGCPAFNGDNSVHCDNLIEWLAVRPEILEAAQDQANTKVEEALIKRNKRIISDTVVAKELDKLIDKAEAVHTVFRAITELKNGVLGALKTGIQDGAADAGLNPTQAQTVFLAAEKEMHGALERFSCGKLTPENS